MAVLEDEEILKLYIERSENAVSETAKKYERYCHYIAYSILCSNEEAEECVNDTYLNAWNAIPPHMPEKLSAFLGKLTRNIALNRYKMRKTSKRGSGQTAIALSELSECVDMSADVAEENERRLLSQAVDEFLAKTERSKRIIFVQRYWYLMKIKDIAAENDMKDSKVKTILFRMRTELKEYLQEKDLF